MKNYMSDIAKMFGLELGEEFDIENCTFNPYKFTEDGLLDHLSTPRSTVLDSLLIGNLEISKKPWKPKDGEKYYFLSIHGVAFETQFYFDGDYDSIRLRLGNFFKTQEEATANKGRWLEYLNQEPDLSWRNDEAD